MSQAETASYHVYPYGTEILNQLFTKYAGHQDLFFVSSKVTSEYFKEYFQTLQAKTILVEPRYIDHDFLEDYVGYYSKCFSQYNKYCVRLHFLV